jgi:hypothetical protein
MSKPTRQELVGMIENLLLWATRGNKVGNPYCKPEIENALRLLAQERGLSPDSWLDFNIRAE